MAMGAECGQRWGSWLLDQIWHLEQPFSDIKMGKWQDSLGTNGEESRVRSTSGQGLCGEVRLGEQRRCLVSHIGQNRWAISVV